MAEIMVWLTDSFVTAESASQVRYVYKIADDAGNSQLNVTPSSLMVRRVSVRQFVVAGDAAGFAVHEAVGAEAHFELGVAVHAEFFAPATRFRPLALDADDAA